MKKILLTLLLIVTALPALAGRDDSEATPEEVSSELQRLKESMVLVEGGTFLMGTEGTQTTVAAFYISQYEVTQGLWRAVMGTLGYYNQTRDDLLPSDTRSWDACQEFIKKLNELTGENYRMPTEAEWEFAAHGGNKTQGYLYAGSNNLEEVAHWTGEDGSYAQVGSKNPNELGLYDMTGNASEFVADGIDDVLPGYGLWKAIVKGGWYGSPKSNLLITHRDTVLRQASMYYTTFRLAKDAIQQPPHRPFFISYQKDGQNQQATVGGIRFVASQYGSEAYAWQPADDEWQSYTSLAADGFDIANVRSISRYRIELAEAGGEELKEALEEEALSGTADCQAIVAALEANPNVDDVQTDDVNVIVKEEGDSLYTVYPMLLPDDPFLTDGLAEYAARLERELQPLKAGDNKKKVAIFNYFDGLDDWKGQNVIVRSIEKMFKAHGYDATYYGYNGFTAKKLQEVVDESRNSGTYSAIIIMTHGLWAPEKVVSNNGSFEHGTPQAFFATADELESEDYTHDDYLDGHSQFCIFNVCAGMKKNTRNRAYKVSALNVGPDCILYVGACFAFNDPGILQQCTWVGWNGQNSLAQAHSAAMFDIMLNQHSMDEALSWLWTSDVHYKSQLVWHNTSSVWLANSAPDGNTYDPSVLLEYYYPNRTSDLLTSADQDKELDISFDLSQKRSYLHLEMEPVGAGRTLSTSVSFSDKSQLYVGTMGIPKGTRGLYKLRAYYYKHWYSTERTYLTPKKPVYLACSDKFNANDAVVLKPAKTSKIVMTTAKEPGEELGFGYYYDEDIWFDMNNNGVREPGEYPDWGASDFTIFYPKVQSQTFTIYGNLTQMLDCGSYNFTHNYNRLTSIDMSEYYGDLETLYCSYNELTELVLPQGTPLKYVWAAHNNLTELSVPVLYDLVSLDVQSNPGLKLLNVGQLPSLVNLYCQNCTLETLDVSQNTELAQLLCDGNRLTSLDLATNQKLLALGCNYNSLPKDALEGIYSQLPDITNVSADTIHIDHPQLFRMLRANGNPGYYEANRSIAEMKGWEFEDKWVATTRRRLGRQLAAGGGAAKE